MSKLTEALEQLDSGRELIERVHEIASKLYDTFDCESLPSLVAAEIRMELPGAERDHIFLSGSGDLCINWPFKEIVEGWIEVYSDDTDESNDALRRIGDQFIKLGRMLHEAADTPARE